VKTLFVYGICLNNPVPNQKQIVSVWVAGIPLRIQERDSDTCYAEVSI